MTRQQEDKLEAEADRRLRKAGVGRRQGVLTKDQIRYARSHEVPVSWMPSVERMLYGDESGEEE
jgi:hypothetical protein